jgi:hypothetical protein
MSVTQNTLCAVGCHLGLLDHLGCEEKPCCGFPAYASAWQKNKPDVVGWWWYYETTPIPVLVKFSKATKKFFIANGPLSVTRQVNVDDLRDGYWLRIADPPEFQT